MYIQQMLDARCTTDAGESGILQDTNPLSLVQVYVCIVELVIISIVNDMVSHNCRHLPRIANESWGQRSI